MNSWRQKLSCNLYILLAVQEVLLSRLDPQMVFGRQLQHKQGSWMSLQLNSRACTVHNRQWSWEGTQPPAPVKLHQLVLNHQVLGINSPCVQPPIFRVNPRRGHWFWLHWELPKGKARSVEQTEGQGLACTPALSKLDRNLQSSSGWDSSHIPRGPRS